MSNLNQGALPACQLTDLTDLPRVGFRGRDSAAWLQQRGYSLPELPNRAVAQADGSAVLRLSQTEYFLLGSKADAGQRIAAEEADWLQDSSANYLLPREDSHAWLTLTGSALPQLMAKLCGVDLRPDAFPEGAVAQTSAARINVIVVHLGGAFHVLFDRCSFAYFTAAVRDAMQEFE